MSLTDGLNESQKLAVLQTEGPLLVIAGPGSGKTLTLVRRTLHIIQSGLAKPEEIYLCSFTEKSAHELRERISLAADEFGIREDLSNLVVGTIHSICRKILDANLHLTPLGNNYDVLDDITKLLFIYQNFNSIVATGSDESPFIEGKYATKWTAIKGLSKYFDKIAEELINPDVLGKDKDPQTRAIANAYKRYLELLAINNKVDFAHLQAFALSLLEGNEPILPSLPKYVMVDEFQDTNYVQERVVSAWSKSFDNLCVVGDEDQSLYRFRGGTVENILKFTVERPTTKSYELDLNYRSEPKIVKFYKDFMESGTWERDSIRYRFPKNLEPANLEEEPYPTVYINTANNAEAEAIQISKQIRYLKDSGYIEDYSEVAILMRSVREKYSLNFKAALSSFGIKSFCPRAKSFFSNEEVGLLIACLAYVLDWPSSDKNSGRVWDLEMYIKSFNEDLKDIIDELPRLSEVLDSSRAEIRALTESETLDKRVADYLFMLLSAEPFKSWMLDVEKARNLARLSQYFSIFHQYYGFPVITGKALESLKYSLFNSFISFLVDGGSDEYEDADSPFPKDHVQIMTIHQAKGLEFPVIFTCSLNHAGRNDSREIIDRIRPYMQREPSEPEDMIAEFDSMRLFYVAFSRAKNLLILSTNGESPAHARFLPVLSQAKNLTQSSELQLGIKEKHKTHEPLRKSFSFTSDIQAFETCKRQYKFFNLFDFSPSRALTILFGTLVHQTIEDIHKAYLRGEGTRVDVQYIEEKFEFNYRMLQLKEVRSMAEAQRKAALKHVISYWTENIDYLPLVRESEVAVRMEKGGYILNGAIDLISSCSDGYEIVDFKTGAKPDPSDDLVRSYYNQLCIYAHILSQRTGEIPAQLVLYWTGEYEREKARMVFQYDEEAVLSALNHFEAVVKEIQNQNFEMDHAPDPKICNECDFKKYCKSAALID